MRIYDDFRWVKDDDESPIGATNGDVPLMFDNSQLDILRALQARYESAVSRGTHAYAVLEGEAGTGKTFLTLALLEWIRTRYPDTVNRMVVSGQRGAARATMLGNSNITRRLVADASATGPWGEPKLPQDGDLGALIVDEAHSLPLFGFRDFTAQRMTSEERRVRFLAQLENGGPSEAGEGMSPLAAHILAAPRLLLFVWDGRQRAEANALTDEELNWALTYLDQQGWDKVELPELMGHKRASHRWGQFVSRLVRDGVICPISLRSETTDGVYELSGDFPLESGEVGFESHAGRTAFEGRLVGSPQALERAVHGRKGDSYRLLATYDWVYSPTSIAEQVFINRYRWRAHWNTGTKDLKSWSITPDYALRPGPEITAWGLGYATLVQGFEFDTVGVIIGDQTVLRPATCSCGGTDHLGMKWVVDPNKKKPDLDHALAELTILLTRARRKCLVFSADEETLELLGLILRAEVSYR